MELLDQMEIKSEVTCSWVTLNKFMIAFSIRLKLKPMYSNSMAQTSMAAYFQMHMVVKMNQRRIFQMILQLLFPQLCMISTTAQ